MKLGLTKPNRPQLGESFGIGVVRLPSVDVAGIDHLDRCAGLLQGGVEAVPVDASTFHHYQPDTEFQEPSHPGAAGALEASEGLLMFFHSIVVRFNDPATISWTPHL